MKTIIAILLLLTVCASAQVFPGPRGGGGSGGGTNYTAGQAITIAGTTISVNTNFLSTNVTLWLSSALLDSSSGIIPLTGSTVALDFNVAKTNCGFSINITNAVTTFTFTNLPATSQLIPMRIAATCSITGTIILPAALKIAGSAAGLTNLVIGSNYIFSIEALSPTRAEGILVPVLP